MRQLDNFIIIIEHLPCARHTSNLQPVMQVLLL